MLLRKKSSGRFEAQLERLLKPLEHEGGASVCVVTPWGHRWVLRSAACQFPSTSPPTSELARTCIPEQVCLRAECAAAPQAGDREVWLCGSHGVERHLGLVSALSDVAAQCEGLEDERDGLCDELGASYESLAAVYKLSSNPALLLDSEQAFALILDQLVAFDPAWRAGFWQVEGDDLVPALWRNATRLARQKRDEGILGRALESRRGIIVDEIAALAWAMELEQRFDGAGSLAVTPMWCRGEALGCLAVWSPKSAAFDSRHMGLLIALASQAVMIQECARLYRQRLEDERLRQELEIGGKIQRALLYGRAPRGLPRLDVGVVSMPSRHIDGDFFEFMHGAAGGLDVVIGDVMGKGLPAALVGAAVKNELFRVLACAAGGALEPASIVGELHRGIAYQLVELEAFVTLCYARVEPEHGRLTYVDCGHTSGLHLRASDDRVLLLTRDLPGRVNLPLGMDPKSRFEQVCITCEPGDLFVFYSDGVTEAMNHAGEMFGVNALAALVRECRDRPAADIAEIVRIQVSAFAGNARRTDDLTCVVVRIAAPESTPPALDLEAKPGHLQEVRDFVAQAARAVPELSSDAQELFRVQLALVEAVTNVVKHAYEPGHPGRVRLESRASGDALTFTLLDHGRAFDPRDVPAPAFDGSRPHGFGVFLLHETMAEVRYQRDARGTNRLTLVWKPKKPEAPA